MKQTNNRSIIVISELTFPSSALFPVDSKSQSKPREINDDSSINRPLTISSFLCRNAKPFYLIFIVIIPLRHRSLHVPRTRKNVRYNLEVTGIKAHWCAFVIKLITHLFGRNEDKKNVTRQQEHRGECGDCLFNVINFDWTACRFEVAIFICLLVVAYVLISGLRNQ